LLLPLTLLQGAIKVWFVLGFDCQLRTFLMIFKGVYPQNAQDTVLNNLATSLLQIGWMEKA
jgi:hypothetical protein